MSRSAGENERILILSDTHLGRPRWAAASAQALRPLWRDCTQLVMNGDIAEIHHPNHWLDAARQTMRLFDMCEADGVKLTLLSGNHDPFISEARHLQLAAGSVFITHGDALHPAIAPWSPRAARMRQRHVEALRSIPIERRDTLEARLSAARLAAHEEWKVLREQAARSRLRGMLLRPWAIAQVLWYWRQFPRMACEFLDVHAPQAKFAVLGHTHRPGISKVNGRIIINTGSFGFPGSPRAVTIENQRMLSVWKISFDSRRYQLANHPVAKFDLPEPPASRPAPSPKRGPAKVVKVRV